MRYRNKIGWTVLSLILIAFFVSYGGGSGTSLNKELDQKIFSMQISDAQGFLITDQNGHAVQKTGRAREIQAPTGRALNLDANSLYKVIAGDSLMRVPITDAEGNDIFAGAIRPTEIKSVNSEYLFMKFSIKRPLALPRHVSLGSASGFVRRVYLVHKKSGLAYNASDAFKNTFVMTNGRIGVGAEGSEARARKL